MRLFIKLLIIITFVTALVEFVIITKQNKIIEYNNTFIAKTRFELLYFEEQAMIARRMMQFTIGYSGRELNPLTILETEGEDTVYLGNLIEENRLVFRFKNNQCSPCINDQMSIINEFSNKREKIIIFSDKTDQKEIQNFKRYNKIETNIYTVDNLLNSIDSLNVPYYFVIKSDLKIEDIYFPDKSLPHLTKKYLKDVLVEL